jgi:hypothetical protein
VLSAEWVKLLEDASDRVSRNPAFPGEIAAAEHRRSPALRLTLNPAVGGGISCPEPSDATRTIFSSRRIVTSYRVGTIADGRDGADGTNLSYRVRANRIARRAARIATAT